jgi:hypothetical protein
MGIGVSTKNVRRQRSPIASEVGETPVGMKVSPMDSHGGWIGTPTNLLHGSDRSELRLYIRIQ